MNLENIDPQAEALNQTLQSSNPVLYNLLSKRGRAIFFPKLGILSQAAEAKGKDINATIGIAKEDDGPPMVLDCISEHVSIPVSKSFPYAPSPGTPEIRKAWKAQMAEKNPSLNMNAVGQPVVTNALTHALSMAGYMFVDEGETIILPDLYWENYDLTFGIAYQNKVKTYTTFTEAGGFNVEGLKQSIEQSESKKIITILNFPNNPTGYSPTNEEALQLADILKTAAEKGKEIVVMLDDAYFGLFFESEIYKESLFAKLADAHENILAIKLDGPTKEDYVWGFRVGFLTFGNAKASPEAFQALEAKTAGAIRGTISNASHLSQSILAAAWQSESYAAQKQEKFKTFETRYKKIREILAAHPEFEKVFSVLPFNSGYFMCIRLKKGNGEEVRQCLLNNYSTGVIANGDIIRLAFSSTPTHSLEALFENVAKAGTEC